MWRDAGTLLTNLLPTAIESVVGFLLGNLASVLLAIAFVLGIEIRWMARTVTALPWTP